MLEQIKYTVRGLARPLYAPVARALRRRLGRNYFAHPEMELPPPYESIQLDVERNLHKYLHVTRDKISQIVIVGAYEADEVDRFRREYPRACFLCFEPNPSTYQKLTAKFKGRAEVVLSNLALSSATGRAQFFELEQPGNGSVLEPDPKKWAAFNQRESRSASTFEVNLSTLDLETTSLPLIDLLWMDVQGAESAVLNGGREALSRTSAVFLEVWVAGSPYNGTALFPEVQAILLERGFTCVGLGLDPLNGVGNALFVSNFEERVGLR